MLCRPVVVWGILLHRPETSDLQAPNDNILLHRPETRHPGCSLKIVSTVDYGGVAYPVIIRKGVYTGVVGT
jgi:hypothetical protein